MLPNLKNFGYYIENFLDWLMLQGLSSHILCQKVKTNYSLILKKICSIITRKWRFLIYWHDSKNGNPKTAHAFPYISCYITRPLGIIYKNNPCYCSKHTSCQPFDA